MHVLIGSILGRAALFLIAVGLCGCEARRYEVDFVIAEDQTFSYFCEEAETCKTASGYWWPLPGTCSSWTDVGVSAKAADCELGVEFFVGGTQVPASMVVAGASYEIEVSGCGHDSEQFSVSVPPLDFAVEEVTVDDGNVVVDYSSSGASVMQLWTTLGFGAVGMHCSNEAKLSDQLRSTHRGTVSQAQISAYSDFELTGSFGTVRIWVGTRQSLAL